MPTVNIAMERSLRPGVAERFMDLLSASLRPAFERRDVITDAQGKVNDVKTAFSSWDNCMQAVYCKWPVIAIIVVGGLFLLSIVYCISRCLCCGLSCCCECCQCLKCCGNCCGCCDPPRGRKHKYLDEPFVPPHHAQAAAGYKSHDPMFAGPATSAPAPISPFGAARAGNTPPQYAEFDVSKKAPGGEDALPVMPTWESAGSKKVLVEEEEAVEMDHLKKPEQAGGAAAAAAGAAGAAGRAASPNGHQNVPLMTGASAVPGPVSPIPSPDHRSPYSPPPGGGPHGAGGYMDHRPGAPADPYAAGRGYNNFSGPGAYGQQSQTTLGADQGYGMAAGAGGPGGRRSPRDYNNNNNNAGYGQSGYQDPYGQDGHDQGYPAPSRPGMAAGGYNSYNSSRTQGSYDSYNNTNNSQQQPYGRGMRSAPPGRGIGGNLNPNNAAIIPPAGSYPQERLGRTPPPRAAAYGGERTYSPAPIMPTPSPSQQQQQQTQYHELPSPTFPPHQQQSQQQPQRQATYEMPAEPVAVEAPSGDNNNAGGFDFGSGYSRPQPQRRGTGGGDGSSSRQEMPAGGDRGYAGSRPARTGGGGGGGGQQYPGYRPYNAQAGQGQGRQGW